MNIGQRQPIASITQAPPTVKTKVGMRVVVEKIPATPYNRKFVRPDGNVVRLVLATGRTIRGPENNPYGNMKRRQKIDAGWLPFSHCPITMGYVKVAGELPCQGPDVNRPGDFSVPDPQRPWVLREEECCKHVQQAIDERRADHREKQNEMQEKFRNSTDRLVELLRKNAEDEAAAHASQSGSEPSSKKAFGKQP